PLPGDRWSQKAGARLPVPGGCPSCQDLLLLSWCWRSTSVGIGLGTVWIPSSANYDSADSSPAISLCTLEFIPIKVLVAAGSGAPGSCAGEQGDAGLCRCRHLLNLKVLPEGALGDARSRAHTGHNGAYASVPQTVWTRWSGGAWA